MAAAKPDKRIVRLLKNYTSAKIEGRKEGYNIKTVVDDNYEHYYIMFRPRAGIYKDQTHILEMKTTYGAGNDAVSYPINAPYMRFLTNVYHTNISVGGAICLDILKDKSKWMPTYDFNMIILNILLLFENPNNQSPFNGQASADYVACEKNFNAAVSKNMTVAEVDELREKMFAPFKKIADDYTKTNKLSIYSKWFPVLDGKIDPDEELEIAKTSSMLEQLTVKAPVEKPVETPVEKPADAPAKPAVNKWAKYQKK